LYLLTYLVVCVPNISSAMLWRREGLTAEEFITRPGSVYTRPGCDITRPGSVDTRPTCDITRPGSASWMKTSNLLSTRSRYDAFRQIVAQWLRVSDDAVDLFSVVNHPTQPRTVECPVLHLWSVTVHCRVLSAEDHPVCGPWPVVSHCPLPCPLSRGPSSVRSLTCGQSLSTAVSTQPRTVECLVLDLWSVTVHCRVHSAEDRRPTLLCTHWSRWQLVLQAGKTERRCPGSSRRGIIAQPS